MKKIFEIFFILSIVSAFFFSCASSPYTTGFSPNSSNFLNASVSKQKEIKKPKFLTANMGDALKISFPSDLFKWNRKTRKERGRKNRDGSVNWAWTSFKKEYQIDLIEDLDNKVFESGSKRGVFLISSHNNLIRHRYKKALLTKKITEIIRDTSLINSKIEGISYTGITAIADYSSIKVPERVTTILFKNKKGNRCLMFFIKDDYRDPTDLLEIVKKYARIDPDYVVLKK